MSQNPAYDPITLARLATLVDQHRSPFADDLRDEVVYVLGGADAEVLLDAVEAVAADDADAEDVADLAASPLIDELVSRLFEAA